MSTPPFSWAQELGGHSGHFQGDFKAGKALLEWAYPIWTACKSAQRRWGRTAVTMNVLTATLAAVAGITVLPQTISVYFSAGVAFAATLVSLLILALDPQGKAASARTSAAALEHLKEKVGDYALWLDKLPQTADPAAIASKLEELRAQRNLIEQLPGC